MDFGPLILFVAGVGIATVAMAIGIGGGILWTPLLILGFGLSPIEAVTTSMTIQVVGLASGSLAFLRSGTTMPRLSLTLAAAALPGVILGSVLAVSLPQAQVQMALGVMAMTLSLLFVATQEPGAGSDGGGGGASLAGLGRLLPIPAFFGLMMGVLSVGIGEWILPALKQRLRLAMGQAVGAVTQMMFLLVLVAAPLHWTLSGPPSWELLIWGGAGTLVGGQIGPRIARRIEERLLKEAFIYLMTLIGIHLIFQAL